jgi:hypothetical protein
MTFYNRNSPETVRNCIFRIYWDGNENPSVLAPIGDFFGIAHGRTTHFMSPYIGRPEGKSFQCYFPMPFSRRCVIEIENDSGDDINGLYYQIDYTLGDEIDEDTGRFHAHFRRENPCPVDKDFTLLDIKGSPGIFVGAVIGVNPIGPNWWGEGEMKFYIDGDDKYPTICGTGAEDYLCTAWGMGLHSAIYTGKIYGRKDPQTEQDRFVSFYRFHIHDPIFFESDLRVELQQIGAPSRKFLEMHDFEKVGRTHPDSEKLSRIYAKYGWVGPHVHPDTSDWLFDRSDDYCSVAYWYQYPSPEPLPPLPDRQQRIKDIAMQPWEQEEQ